MTGEASASRPGSALRHGAGRYDVLLVVVLVLLALSPFELSVARVGLIGLAALAFLYALWTSAVPRRAMPVAVALAVLTVVASGVAEAVGGKAERAFADAMAAGLCLLTVLVLVVRLAPKRRVSSRVLAAGVAVYLLFGVLFAQVFALIGVVRPEGFFAQPGPHNSVSYLYFSFITLTSVGYGDLTPVNSEGQMMSALEALLGQLYLVTVIAYFVSVRERR